MLIDREIAPEIGQRKRHPVGKSLSRITVSRPTAVRYDYHISKLAAFLWLISLMKTLTKCLPGFFIRLALEISVAKEQHP